MKQIRNIILYWKLNVSEKYERMCSSWTNVYKQAAFYLKFPTNKFRKISNIIIILKNPEEARKISEKN